MAIDPQKDLNGFIDQWNQASKQYEADYSQLLAMIQQMLALAKKGEVGAAFQMAQNEIMPGTMQVQGDSMSKLAASMNIASALEEFTTEAQNDMNGTSGPDGKPDSQKGNDLLKLLKEFFNEINTLPPPPWLDPSTKANLDDAITKIYKSLGFTGPSDPGLNTPGAGAQVAAMISYWINNPSVDHDQNGNLNPGGKTGQQMLQDLQSGFTQWNNTESAQSQVLQSQEQFASNTYNQYMNTVKSMFQTAQQQYQVMVQNQKTQ